MKSGGLRFFHSPPDAVTLFGASITPAPLQITIFNVRVRNRRQLESFLRHARFETGIVVLVSCPLGAVINAIPRSKSVAQAFGMFEITAEV